LKKYLKPFLTSAQGENIPIEGKIEKIAQAMETYRSHITELTELLPPSTPPEVRTQREQEATYHTKRIVLVIQK
jgi:hypothetical protein